MEAPAARTFEVIPRRNLSPSVVPEVFVLQTPFPPDDRSVGYERGTSISKAWDQATTDAAIEVADYVAAHLKDLAGVEDRRSRTASAKLREFCRRFAERAFRRPLTDEQKAFFIDRQFKEVDDPETAVKRVVLLVLKSPRFLYREIGSGKPDGLRRGVAALVRAVGLAPRPAAAGRRGRRPARHARAGCRPGRAHGRATSAPARSSASSSCSGCKVDQVPEIAKDPKRFPRLQRGGRLRPAHLARAVPRRRDRQRGRRFPPAPARGLRSTSTAGWRSSTAPICRPTRRSRRSSRTPGERAGVLTHPYLMASFAYTATSSPIHRGVFLSRSVLGRVLRPPPEAVAPLAADLHPDLTTRQRVELQTKPESCQSCHGMINPLGFTLEHFDAVGRYRERGERAADRRDRLLRDPRRRNASSSTASGELAAFLAGSEETHTAFVQQLFHYLVKQPIRAYGPPGHCPTCGGSSPRTISISVS